MGIGTAPSECQLARYDAAHRESESAERFGPVPSDFPPKRHRNEHLTGNGADATDTRRESRTDGGIPGPQLAGLDRLLREVRDAISAGKLRGVVQRD